MFLICRAQYKKMQKRKLFNQIKILTVIDFLKKKKITKDEMSKAVKWVTL